MPAGVRSTESVSPTKPDAAFSVAANGLLQKHESTSHESCCECDERSHGADDAEWSASALPHNAGQNAARPTIRMESGRANMTPQGISKPSGSVVMPSLGVSTTAPVGYQKSGSRDLRSPSRAT